MKWRSLGVSLSCQSVRSAERSISSAVQKEATCCLYMDQRSACCIGKREKREPSSSVRQIGSMNSSLVVDVDIDVEVEVGVLASTSWAVVALPVLPPRG